MTAADQHQPLTAAQRVQLLTRVGRGEQEAFAELYDDLAPVAYGVARRVVHDPDLATDITQEAMVDLWRTAARYRPADGPVSAWVALLARRRGIDRVRAEQAHRDRNAQAANGSFDRPFDDVAEEVVGKDQARGVRRCLATLTSLQREAVVQAFYGGSTYREVARQSGAALPTVKSRIRDGLRRLRTCLDASAQGGRHA